MVDILLEKYFVITDPNINEILVDIRVFTIIILFFPK